jgi:hypothetical protein
MGIPNERVIVTVATPLQPELAQRIAAVDGRVEVRYAQRLACLDQSLGLLPLRTPMTNPTIVGLVIGVPCGRFWGQISDARV